MRPEYCALITMTFLFLLAWVPVSFGKLKTFGASWVGSNREPVKDKELPQWAQRCDRAYNNLKDYFPGFVVAILLLGQTNHFTHGTTIAAFTYVIARIVHYISYGIGNVPVRAVAFLIGMGANFYLLSSVVF